MWEEVGMGTEDGKISELQDKIIQMFSEFMLSVTKFEELVAVGSRLFVGFQQALEFLRRPSIEKTSELVEGIIKLNQTKRVLSYVGAGCITTHESVQNVSKLHTCQAGLWDHLHRVKSLLDEVEFLLKNVTDAMQSANRGLPHLQDKYSGDESPYDTEETLTSDLQKSKVADFAAMMAVIYSMLKQDFLMQKKIVSSLNLKSSSGELESYIMMWSLRPFVNDDVLHQAWKLIP